MSGMALSLAHWKGQCSFPLRPLNIAKLTFLAENGPSVAPVDGPLLVYSIKSVARKPRRIHIAAVGGAVSHMAPSMFCGVRRRRPVKGVRSRFAGRGARLSSLHVSPGGIGGVETWRS